MTKRYTDYDDNGDVLRGIPGRTVLSGSSSSVSRESSASREYANSYAGVNRSASTTTVSSSVGSATVGHSSGGQGYADKSRPKMAFRHDGIEYWGSAHSNLDDAGLGSDDLLINGYGTAYVCRPFIKSAPSWMNLTGMTGVEPHQLLLDWKDFSPPPRSINIDFWESIVAQAKQEGISRIVVCCGAGLGRTGTALASLALASGYVDDPEDAVNYIRSGYTVRAIETKQQELYIWSLVKNPKEFPAEGFQRYNEPVRSDRQLAIRLEDDDAGEAWSSWTKTNNNK